MSPGARTGPGHGAARGSAQRKANACPLCGKMQAEAYRPFCSKRCADIDLGRWLGGRYAIPGAPADKAKPEADDEG